MRKQRIFPVVLLVALVALVAMLPGCMTGHVQIDGEGNIVFVNLNKPVEAGIATDPETVGRAITAAMGGVDVGALFKDLQAARQELRALREREGGAR